MAMKRSFSRFATAAAAAQGHWLAFTLAVLLIVVWAASGPFLAFSSVWQLTVNTATTIITFLGVFLIQNAQNRDAKATALKLDELIRAVDRANNAIIGIEQAPDDEIERDKQAVKQAAERTA